MNNITQKLTLVAIATFCVSSATFAAPTTISFPDQATLTNAFPTTVASGMYSGPTADTNVHGQDVAKLTTGDLTMTNGNRAGKLTIYSAASYSSGLDFITGDGLSLTFSNARLDTPRGTTWGKIGITSANTGTMGSQNGIYLFFNRAGTATNNTVELIQAVGGTETTLATLISGSVPGMFDAQTFSLSLTTTNWSMSLITQDNSGIPVSTNLANGVFGTAWTTNNWGLNTYLGLEANQQTTLTGNVRYAQLTVGSIQFEQIPEPGITALLLGASVAIFAGVWLRRKKC